MIRNLLFIAATLAITSNISSANVISVYEVFDGKEKLIAQKDISSEWEGDLYYNPCRFNPDIKSVDYPKCESYIHYRNFVSGDTIYQYEHKEFTKSANSIYPDKYTIQVIKSSAPITTLAKDEEYKSDEITMRINIAATPMLIKDETYEALKRMQSHQK